MRTGRQYLALGGVTFLLAVACAFAQKVTLDYDQSNDFTRYKRYAIGQNYLLTHQRPEDEARIGQVLVESLNRQLQAKGFVLDEDHPDFRVHYEAGGLTTGAVSTQPDVLVTPAPGPISAPTNFGGLPLDAWTSTLTKLKLTVTDVSSGRTVWTALASQKIRDPQKALRDLNKKVDDIMRKTLKSFPPASKPGANGSRVSAPGL
jgi:Domain of unknown function (DUF4136)